MIHPRHVFHSGLIDDVRASKREVKIDGISVDSIFRNALTSLKKLLYSIRIVNILSREYITKSSFSFEVLSLQFTDVTPFSNAPASSTTSSAISSCTPILDYVLPLRHFLDLGVHLGNISLDASHHVRWSSRLTLMRVEDES
jgi:hypothetical protein